MSNLQKDEVDEKKDSVLKLRLLAMNCVDGSVRAPCCD